MSNKHESIDISQDLFDRIEDRVQATDFESVSDYISYVMEEVLLHVENENPLDGSSDVDEQQVRERLESLGYLKD